ncbi:MAG TPA: hypothetical protein VNA44_00495 [Burkholderiaceae bacterium]|nr:hypothetical protein [Burkholderiaceae bacterium]
MSALDFALVVLVIHGALGGLDTLYCHELQARLPKQPWAARELQVHSTRSFLYAVIFIGVAWFEWHGAFAWLLLAVFAIEYAITLIDAVVEDRTRRLSRAERIVHMILGATTGAYIALVAYHASTDWIGAPTGLRLTDHGVVSLILSVYGAGVIVSSVRDARASRQLQAVGTPL